MNLAEHIGNIELLGRQKESFLCSRTVSSGAVLRCYDWATEVANNEECVVMGGFQSKIEQDVLRFLMRGQCRIILVLARQLYKRIPAELQSLLDAGRLLILTTAPSATRVSHVTAEASNRYVASADRHITFGYIAAGSPLTDLFDEHRDKSTLLTP